MKKILNLMVLWLAVMIAFPAHATVNSETTKVQYSCNGVVTSYAYPFRILADADLLVIKTQTSTGAETTLGLNAQYTVTGAGVVAGGNVVLTAGSVCGSGYTLTIMRDMDLLQQTDYVDGESFSAESFEDALDKVTMVQQQQAEEIGRSPKIPRSSSIAAVDLPNPSANNYIGWNAAATNLENKTAPVVTTATQYEVDALVSYGGGTSYTKATIDAALTAIGTTDKVTLLLRPGTWVIGSNADWSAYANVTFKLVPGAVLQIATGTTTTIGGPLDAGFYQIFNCVGTGAVRFSIGSVEAANVLWFGAKDLTSSATAIQKAIDSVTVMSSKVYIPRGRYDMGTTGITITGSIVVYGDAYGSELQWDTAFTGTGITVDAEYVTLRSFTVYKPNRGIAPVNSLIAIDIQHHDSYLEQVKVTSSGVGAFAGWYTGIKYAEWTHSLIRGEVSSYYNGISGNVNGLTISHSIVSAAESTGGSGIILANGAGNVIIGSDVEGTAYHGIRLEGNGNGPSSIIGGYIEGQTGYGIYLIGTDAAHKLQGVSVVGVSINATGVVNGIGVRYADGIQLQGNRIVEYSGAGILLISDVTNIDYEGNSISSGAGGSVKVNRASTLYALTPTDASGASLAFSAASAWYIRNGAAITVTGTVTYPATADGSSNLITVLPVTSNSLSTYGRGSVLVAQTDSLAAGGISLENTKNIRLCKSDGTVLTNADLSGKYVYFSVTYMVDETVN